MNKAFGIDFGTTNTRVAYFDGEKVSVIPFSTKAGLLYQLPTVVAYQNQAPVAFGSDALLLPSDQGAIFPSPLKWILGTATQVEVQGGCREPVDVVADYLRNLRQLVEASRPGVSLNRTAVTIPVHYPPTARRDLAEAFRRAEIDVSHFFFEPIAAIYAGLVGEPVSGTAAVFDWGGGSLDIATVELRDGVALTRQVDGWHRGGTHFDRMIAEQAINDFLDRHRDHPSCRGITAEMVLGDTSRPGMQAGRELRLQAQYAKERLSRDGEVPVNVIRFLGIGVLDYPLTQRVFSELIGSDLTSALTRLDRALKASGVTSGTLARLFLSGGTCRVPEIREQIAKQFARRVRPNLRLPDWLVDQRATGGLDDIGNATAIGAALLAAYGATPIFASAIGVRLAGGDMGEQFLPVFRTNVPVPFDTPQIHRFFVSDASSRVARLLICDQTDAVREPAGRLLRVITVPISDRENWVDVRVTLDRHLTLRVEALGRQSMRVDQALTAPWPTEPQIIQTLNLGFRIPHQN